MRLSTVIVSLACAFGLVAAFPFNGFVADPATIEECGDEDDLLQMHNYTLTPNPPEKGKNLTIEAYGSLSEDVVEGATIHLTVKLGLIKLLTTKLDFCEESAKINKNCPLEAGEQSLYHSVELPKEIPPGKYVVNIKVLNPDEKQVTCLIAKAQFGIK
ncbi:Phosphatidylglycerol/phosphatidylinositol transfer protein [Mortierella alpina]|nr:Phosphatidylglycerol/phosphatidylinositol transfer protein [Mortierella alpina]